MAVDNLTRLHHMHDAAREALSFMSGIDRSAFEQNRMLTLAVVKDLEIIGEAASQITTECKAKYSQISWADMTGMRNRLIHAYFGIDLDIVWDTVTNDLPPLVTQLEKIIQHESKQQPSEE